MATSLFLNSAGAQARLGELGEEFVLLRNPSYIHPRFELAPVAPKIFGPVPDLTAAVMDMDGTTTTTEALCLHSLETMVRRITGRPSAADWAGLDSALDYPHIIGNSTTKHVEYLVRTHSDAVDRNALGGALFDAALWTFRHGGDRQRRLEARATLATLGWQAVLDDPRFTDLLEKASEDEAARVLRDELLADHLQALRVDSFEQQVRAAVDIYYSRYHEILAAIDQGHGAQLSQELMGGRRLIEPMPGVAVFLALLKGWLGAGEAAALCDLFLEQVPEPLRDTLPDTATCRARLATLGRHLEAHPLQVALVTSSIRYEADIVLREVFAVLREQIAAWPVRQALAEDFADPVAFYDAYVTASDSSEIRLKPHRDLYCLALHRLGLAPEVFDTVIGFEDSEPGTIAIRAAGIGLCVAVPFADTHGHNFDAASWTLPGGVPQALLCHCLFLDL